MNRKQRRNYIKKFNTPRKIEQLNNNLDKKIRIEYENKYKRNLNNSIDLMLLALKYTLHFSDSTQFGNKRVNNFMKDLLATFNGFATGEYEPEEYRQALKNENIEV